MIWNTSDSWGWPARSFHWFIALMVLVQFCFGLWMSDVPPRSERLFYYGIHASMGISILALMVLRLLWRLSNRVPAEPPVCRIGKNLLHVSCIGFFMP
jgi:cytochrome b561